jgi:hypothetical protein
MCNRLLCKSSDGDCAKLRTMSKRAVFIALLVLPLTPSLASAQSIPIAQSSCPNVSRNLFIGLEGNDVIGLQNFLIAQNFLPQGDNTGYFGHLTQMAATEFQGKESLPRLVSSVRLLERRLQKCAVGVKKPYRATRHHGLQLRSRLQRLGLLQFVQIRPLAHHSFTTIQITENVIQSTMEMAAWAR